MFCFNGVHVNLIIRVRDHTSVSSGAGPMELVSMACPSVVRGRIINGVPHEFALADGNIVQ
jgi:hypothetical protein